MNPQVDLLKEFETNNKSRGIIYYVLTFVYVFQIAIFLFFLFWFDNKSFESLTEVEVAIFVIEFICPSVALYLFVKEIKLGWALIVFFSVLNIVFIATAFGKDFLMELSNHNLKRYSDNRVYIFFILNILITALVFQRQVVKKFVLTKKYIFFTAGISIAVSVLLVLLLGGLSE